MKRLAVLTSGGDAPGMNAAVRAVVRCAIGRGIEALGVRNGYSGLMSGDFRPLGRRDVGGIIQLGGTVLGTSRNPRFRTEEGQAEAIAQLRAREVDSLIVIGGNGSQSGAHGLDQHGMPVVGIASTIDNDLAGTDITLGATTAVDVALQAIDSLRVTAAAMRRAFLVEVMGRHCGYLAVAAGIAGGAESIVLPEVDASPAQVAGELAASYARGKSHAIGVIAEGARYDADQILAYLKEHRDSLGFDVRMTRLGHIQRGGSPGAFDRLLGSLFGAAAVGAAAAGRRGVLIGMRGGDIAETPLSEVAGRTKPADARLIALAHTLAQ
ncbi:MAG: ATP-dependent 6-phosphofructokinase [Steroidobacteraceae bacterium]